jgi:hypothetical protein
VRVRVASLLRIVQSPCGCYMSLSYEDLERRAQEIRDTLWRPAADGQAIYANSPTGPTTATISLLVYVYGRASEQLANFKESLVRGARDSNEVNYRHRVANAVESVLVAVLADHRAGITSAVQARAKGEVLGDFIALAREALAQQTEGANRVAVVLTAAAFEETLKQLGAEAGAEVYNRDVRGVIQVLKDAEILTGPQSGIARGYVELRDKAFHGQFDQTERASTEGMLAFVEGLVVQQFT